MQITEELLSHITFTSHDEINRYCQPLQSVGIAYFDYVRVYADNSRLHLGNSHTWICDFFEKYYSPEFLYWEKTDVERAGFFISPITLWSLHDKTDIVKEISDKFGVSHGFVVSSYHKNYTEYFYFGPEWAQKKKEQLYLEYLPILKKFIFFFREQAQTLIKHAEHFKFKSPTSPHNDGTRKEITPANFKISKYYLGGTYENVYLTEKEYECLRWIILGKSCEEISLLTSTSRRTVETHLQNMKQKFNCYKVTELIYKACKCDLFF